MSNGAATNGLPLAAQNAVKFSIAIIGAGVGGLSNAIALKQAGHDVVVYEQASQLSEVRWLGFAPKLPLQQALPVRTLSPS